MPEVIEMNEDRLASLLTEAARRGAAQAIGDLTLYTKEQTCELLGISYNTLQRRIREKKIRVVDGRVPGESIRKYLAQHVGNR